ncbi:MAG: CoA-binding protein [Syntrophobacteraceae bacterium]
MTECTEANRPDQEENIKAILDSSKTIAVVGVSHKEERASTRVARYMRAQGYKVIPVNPKYKEVLETTCYPDLKSVPEHIDVVDIFRNVEAIPGIVDEAIEVGAGAVWMQLELVHAEAAEKARCAGMRVVMDKCMKIEHARLAKS